MKPEKRIHNKRCYLTLPKHSWSYIILQKFTEKTKLHFIIAFKRAKCQKSCSYFIKLDGFCKSKSILICTLAEKPNSNKTYITFIIQYKGVFMHYKDKKRHLSGVMKDEAIINIVKEHKTTFAYKNEKTAKANFFYQGTC